MHIYDFTAKTLKGHDMSLANFKGQVLLIVNTASKCGFTPQYEGLQKLYEKLHEKKFSVLGFPSNQFGEQEPGTSDDIATFCQTNYGVSFPMFEKVDVKGANAHPLFKFLTSEAPGLLGTEGIKWNFTKFLVDKDGVVQKRYAPQTPPEKIEEDIEKLLG